MGNIIENFNNSNKNSKTIHVDASNIDYERLNDDIFKTRIEYYMGNVNKKIYIDSISNNSRIFLVDSNIVDLNIEKLKHGIKRYFMEMKNYYRLFRNTKMTTDPKFLFYPGDVSHPGQLPILTKTRLSKNYGLNVLLPLNILRHWAPINEVEIHDIPFKLKKNQVSWRGNSTGRHKRVPLIGQYYNTKKFGNTAVTVDIGLVENPDGGLFVNDYPGIKLKRMIKNKIPISEMLQNKYLISVEGNDVASNLKWILSSQSVCLKPPATVVSWLMEDRLIPWTHYVPLRHDFSDLEYKINWCISHPRKCMEIIHAANDYMRHFKDPVGEESAILSVMTNYNSNVIFV
jgi:hypothetical protein